MCEGSGLPGGPVGLGCLEQRFPPFAEHYQKNPMHSHRPFKWKFLEAGPRHSQFFKLHK